jgi:hypothetical protein
VSLLRAALRSRLFKSASLAAAVVATQKTANARAN